MQDTKYIHGESIKDEVEHLLSPKQEVGTLIIKPASKWLEDASKRPMPRDLYYGLLHEFEFCNVFADTNLGKSIKAVQMGVHIARNGKTVLYLDFELSDKQFEARYSNNYTNHYSFPDNFFRAEINTDQIDYKAAGHANMEDYIAASIERAIMEFEATVLIVDNITYLRTETEKAKDALPLVKHLNTLKKKYDLTILCLAHTPKRDLSRPITENNMAGSKMLMNLCDSAFAIGQSSKDGAIRYIKLIKNRNVEKSGNVIVYQIVKPDNFLHFEFMGYSTESEHLKQMTEKEKEDQKAKVIELRKSGNSLREIASILGTNHKRVDRILKEQL